MTQADDSEIIFPFEMKLLWREPGVKRAWISDYQGGPDLTGCSNCNGSGIFATFIAKAGPFQSPSSRFDDVSHWYNDAWWVGKTYVYPCPVCHGAPKPRGKPVPKPAWIDESIAGMVGAMGKEKTEVRDG